MRSVRSLGLLIVMALLFSVTAGSGVAQAALSDDAVQEPMGTPPPKMKENGQPIGHMVARDGRKTPVYLIPSEGSAIESALGSGLATQAEANAALEWERKALADGVGICPFWTGSPATMISQGRDYDNDWYEDYEHPVGWNNHVVCVTAFYYTFKGFPAEEYHFDYKPGIARHRLKVGLSDFPDWFAAAQTTMRWQ